LETPIADAQRHTQYRRFWNHDTAFDESEPQESSFRSYTSDKDGDDFAHLSAIFVAIWVGKLARNHRYGRTIQVNSCWDSLYYWVSSHGSLSLLV